MKKSQLKSFSVLFASLFLAQSVFVGLSEAQYYPPPGGYGQQPGYNPYPGYSQPPAYGQYPAQGYGYPPQAGYGAPGYAPPPDSNPQSYGHPADTQYGYQQQPNDLDPFATAETPTYNPNMPPGGTGMMAWGSPVPATVAGLKFSYHPQSGDYSSTQSRNAGRWEQFPITLHLTYPEDMSDEDKADVKAAITAWQRYVDIQLVHEPDKAKIELSWATDLSDDEDLGETDITATHMDSMGRTVLDKVVIRMLDPESYPNVYPETLKSAVMHQLGHALGLNSHSDNDRDLMAEPAYKRQKNPIVKKAVASFAAKTLGQFIDLPRYDDGSSKRKVVKPPVIKISKRDLNTLFRLYNL